MSENIIKTKRLTLRRFKIEDAEKMYKNWAIVYDKINEPIGGISVVEEDHSVGMVQVGYCIGREYWNRGITSEALQGVIDFLFTLEGINRIEARHDENNPNSGKVMKKCGMVYEGTLRQVAKNNTGICNSCCYGILKGDYRKYE